MTSGNWTNSDGLYLQFGTAKATTEVAGDYNIKGDVREVEIVLTDLTTVGATAAVISNTTFLPAGNFRIEEVQVVTDTAATGSGAVLNLGLVRSSDRTTEVDFDGLIAALPVTSFDSAGEKTVLNKGSTYAGALIGTTFSSTYPTNLTADYDTAAFTAGAIRIRIKYYGFGTISQ